MNTKLTLSLNKKAIAKAKKYAYKNGKSVSKLVENFFDNLEPEVSDKNEEYSPRLQGLVGIISDLKDADLDKVKSDYLTKKYLK